MNNNMSSKFFSDLFSNEQKQLQLSSLTALLKSQRDNIKDLISKNQASKKDLELLPSKIKIGGVFTQKFLKWNRKQIRDKKLFYYAGEDLMFNPRTNRFSEIKFDKRYKKKVLTNATRKKLLQFNTEFKVIQEKTNQNYSDEIEQKIIDGDFPLEVDLKKIKFQDLVEILYENAGDKKLVTKSADGERWVALSQSNLISLRSINNLTHQENGSDIEYLFESIKSNGIITIEEVKPSDFIDDDDKPKTYSKPAGQFFKYYNTTNFNLERYDIYNDKQKDYKDNCLYIALKNSGKVEIKKLNQIKDLFRNGLIPTCKMTEISKILDVCISINRKISGKTKIIKYGDKEKEVINIGLVEEHYFLVEKTEITRFSLEHYDEVKGEKDFNKIYKCIWNKDKTKKIYKKSNDRFINSLDVVRILLSNENLIQKIPLKDLMDTQFYSSEVENDNLEYNASLYDKELNVSGNLKINEISKTDNNEYFKVFYDFETNTTGEKHTPYLVCFKTEDGRKGAFRGKDCGKYFINHLKKLGKENIMLIAHNQRYDFTFILDYIFCLKPILKGNRLMGGSGRIYKGKNQFIEVKFQDSLNLIPEKLCKFGKMFNLNQEKEVMIYDIYNDENIEKKFIPFSEIKPYFKNEDDKKQFKENCRKWNCIKNINNVTHINIIKYSEKYCEIDVEVLEQGYEKFRNMINEITSLDILNYCSIASLSNDYMISEGCFKDCYSISGVPRAFIQKCVVGGKVMCANNEKIFCDYEQADYDGVSLYPSSMSRMKGFLKGIPKVIKKNQLNKEFLFSDKVDGFFVKVVCKNKPNIHRDFPVLSSMNKEGIRNFHNDTEGEVYYLDKTSFEDAVNFQGLDFEILQGYYYDEGHNNKVNTTIRKLFNERLKMKKLKNPIEKVYKLLMNSSYGKTLLKPIDSETEIVYKNNWNDYLNKNYNFIKEFTKTKDMIIVKKIKPISTHFNNVYAGVEILSMSKRIMNEVMYCAEDNCLSITYTDTDSIHIKYDEVSVLEQKFKEKYGRELTGKNLGQFHIDFDLDGAGDNEEIKSIKSVFLGKKCYMDLLQSKDENGNVIYGEHLRMKGIPEASIKYTCEKLNVTPFELYKKLYDGETIDFDLLCGGSRCNFKYDKDLSVRSLGYIDGKSEFTRSLNFSEKEK